MQPIDQSAIWLRQGIHRTPVFELETIGSSTSTSSIMAAKAVMSPSRESATSAGIPVKGVGHGPNGPSLIVHD